MEKIIIYISAAILIATFIISFYLLRSIAERFKTKPIYILLGGAFISVFTVMLYADFEPGIKGLGTTFFLSLFHAIQIMLLNYDFSNLFSVFGEINNETYLQFFYLAFLFFFAPVCTFGFVLSFFENVTESIKYLLNRNSDIYFISDLSKRSVLLAKSIREKFPKALIYFANCSSSSEDSSYSLIQSAKKIKAIISQKHITDIKLKFHGKKTKAVFFTVNEDEYENLESALKIIDTFRSRPNTELYVLSISKEGELLLDSAEFNYMKVRRINEIRSLAYSILSNDPITEYSRVSKDKKEISALIVGFGGYGIEFTKALLWCSQLPGYKLEINVIDNNSDAESKFKGECPEIFELNNNEEPGEAVYSLNFFNGIDVKTCEYNDILSKLKKTTVVYISLGNDDLNIKTAIDTRIIFERMGLYPSVKAIVHSDIKNQSLKKRSLANHKGESYDIEILGSDKECFSYDNIVNDKLEALALECHLRWANTEEQKEEAIKQFNEYEYYRNSSKATAIHEKYRQQENLDKKLIPISEHMRWNAYMRTEGYIFSGSYDNASRNDRAKLHNNLHKYEFLSKEDADKDLRMVKGNNKEI